MDELQEIREDFLIEAFELIEQMDQDLVELENDPDDLELLNRIFRVAHTVKGSSSFLNFDVLTELTHHMEDVLNKARKDELKITPEIMDVILESVDMMKGLLEAIRDSSSDDCGIEIKDICGRFDAISNGEDVPSADAKADEEVEQECQAQVEDAPEEKQMSEEELANLTDEEVEAEIERLLAEKQKEKQEKKSKEKSNNIRTTKTAKTSSC